jgi:hypothetical protein
MVCLAAVPQQHKQVLQLLLFKLLPMVQCYVFVGCVACIQVLKTHLKPQV